MSQGRAPPTISPTTVDDIEGSFTIAFCLLMVLTGSFAVDRVSHSRLQPKWVAVGLSIFLLLFVGTGTHTILVDLWRLIAARGRSIATPVGIQGFVQDLEGIATLHRLQVVVLIVSMYLVLQTFCIPGTIVLNAAMGALLGTTVGVPLAVTLGTVGASCCYLLSSAFGSRLADAVDLRLMKGKGVPKLRAAVQRHRGELFVYMLFLRLTPILPNWLVNLASPIVHVPLRTFAAATCLGIIPQTYLSVRFGSMVVEARQQQNAAALGSIVTRTDTVFMCCLAVLLVVLGKLRRRFAATAASASGPVVVSVGEHHP